MFLIWLDILGFDKLASIISENIRVDKRKVRLDFIQIINKKIDELVDSGHIIGKRYGQSDDWLLVTKSLDDAYYAIGKIINHHTGYNDYSQIPLEIGLGFSNFDQHTQLDGIGLSIENETIEFLKSDIIYEYRKWYKINNNVSIKDTFIVISERCFAKMNAFDKEKCIKIQHDSKIFYGINLDFFRIKYKFINFLTILSIDQNSFYSALNDVYVEPNEYNLIIETLETNNSIFLVGDPEIGKTFTALKILWHYYLKEYSPEWIRGYDFFDRDKIRRTLSEGSMIKNKTVLYLEDPFGKIQYEDTDTIRREIGNFINIINNKDVKVVFTSRLNIFNQFINAKISEIELRKISIELLLMNPSYNKGSIEKMIINWAQYFQSRWMNNEELKNVVILNASKLLKTPLSIKDFTIEASNKENINEIISIINKKIKEVKISFSLEINNMPFEKILYLSLKYTLFITEDKDIKTKYKELCVINNLNHIKYNYDDLNSEFKYKFETSVDRNEFSHPSYEEGLVESWKNPEISIFILKIMNTLIKDENSIIRGVVGFILTKNYNDLQENESINQIIITILSDKQAKTRMGVALASTRYYKELPVRFKIDMIQQLSKDRHREIRAQSLKMVSSDFDTLPFDLVLEIITKGLNDKAAYTRQSAVETVRANLKSLPKEIAQMALDCNEDLTHYSGWFLSYFASITQSYFKKEVEEYLAS